MRWIHSKKHIGKLYTTAHGNCTFCNSAPASSTVGYIPRDLTSLFSDRGTEDLPEHLRMCEDEESIG